MALLREERPDGTYLVWHDGDNMHLNHWHVASDGTLLSVKEGGDHKYKRSDVRKSITAVTGFDWSHGWKSLGHKTETNDPAW